MNSYKQNKAWFGLTLDLQEEVIKIYNQTPWSGIRAMTLEDVFGKENLKSYHTPDIGDYVTWDGRIGKITEIFPESLDRVFVFFLDSGRGGVWGISELKRYPLSYYVGDKVEVILGKFK